MSEFKIEIDAEAIRKQIDEAIQYKIKRQLEAQNNGIEESIKDFFYKGFHSNVQTRFERSLDFVIDNALQRGLDKAMEELGFIEMIAEKAKMLVLKWWRGSEAIVMGIPRRVSASAYRCRLFCHWANNAGSSGIFPTLK